MNEPKAKKKYYISDLLKSLLYWIIIILLMRYLYPYLGLGWTVLVVSIIIFVIGYLWGYVRIGKQQVPNWLFYTFDLLLYIAFFLMLTRFHLIPA